MILLIWIGSTWYSGRDEALAACKIEASQASSTLTPDDYLDLCMAKGGYARRGEPDCQQWNPAAVVQSLPAQCFARTFWVRVSETIGGWWPFRPKEP